MSLKRMREWFEKSASIKMRSDNSKRFLISRLKNLRPRVFSKYRYEESLALMYLLRKVLGIQMMLYDRFVKGSDVFKDHLSDDKDKDELENIRTLGEELIRVIRHESDLLDDLSDELDRLDDELDLKITRKVLSKGLDKNNFSRFLELFEECSFNIEKRTLQRVHKHLVHSMREEAHFLDDLKQRAVEWDGRIRILLLRLQSGSVPKKIALGVYLGSYVLFFLGVIEHSAFSLSTNISRPFAI